MDNIWERLEDETSKAYRAFTLYRDTPAEERSYQKVADQYYGKTGANKRQIELWGSKYNWVARAGSFDSFILAQELDESTKLRNKHRERMLARYNRVLDMLDDTLDNFKVRQADIIQETPDPRNDNRTLRIIEIRNKMHDARMLVNAFIEADKAMRLALGMPTSISTQHLDHTTDGEKIDNVIEFRWLDMSDNSGFDDEEVSG